MMSSCWFTLLLTYYRLVSANDFTWRQTHWAKHTENFFFFPPKFASKKEIHRERREQDDLLIYDLMMHQTFFFLFSYLPTLVYSLYSLARGFFSGKLFLPDSTSVCFAFASSSNPVCSTEKTTKREKKTARNFFGAKTKNIKNNDSFKLVFLVHFLCVFARHMKSFQYVILRGLRREAEKSLNSSDARAGATLGLKFGKYQHHRHDTKPVEWLWRPHNAFRADSSIKIYWNKLIQLHWFGSHSLFSFLPTEASIETPACRRDKSLI